MYERVPGETFGLRPGDPVESPAVWREIGVDLARLHLAADPASPVAGAALLDWGACGWAGPAADFAGIPLRAVPAMLAGYRSASGTVDDPLRAAIVGRHLQIGLFLTHRSPEPDLSWAERPLGVLVDILRFFAAAPTDWRSVGPPP